MSTNQHLFSVNTTSMHTNTHAHTHTHTHTLLQGLTHSALDVKIAACDVCGELLSPSDQLLTAVLPLLLQSYREKNTALKSSAEMAIYKLIQGTAHMKVRFKCTL